MKAVVLARGLATRMRQAEPGAQLAGAQAAAAAAGLKAMMPVGGDPASPAGPPFLDYVISSLADAGYDEVGLVIGPEHDAIRHRYGREHPPVRVILATLTQPQPLGTANAVLAVEPWVGEAPFVVLNADNLYPVPVLAALRMLESPGLPVFERGELIDASNIPPERVGSFALVEIDADGWLTRIVEKPGAAAVSDPHRLVSMNCWRFDRRIFESCRDVPRSARGEFELPQAVALALERGIRFATLPAHGAVLDLSRQTDVAEVSRRLAAVVPRL
jgi:glucose-1-phosphate thymidylyltransferase